MKVEEEAEKVGIKLKIMASGPITSWQIDGETVEIMTDWMAHKLESRLPGEISTTSVTQMIRFSWQKVKRN